MNSFDASILHWVNQFARQSFLFDFWMSRALNLSLIKGGFFITVLCCYWFANSPERERRREIIVATMIAFVAAFAVGRLLASTLPFRYRPMHNPALTWFVPPYGTNVADLRHWSAFPSDHAMVFAAIATGLWFISPVVGVLSHLYVLTIIDLPRLYLGYHHATDLMMGCAVGIAVGIIANTRQVRKRITPAPLRAIEARPGLAYALAFVIALQVSTMFEDARTMVAMAWCATRGSAECADRLDIPLHPAAAQSQLAGQNHR